jgi:hypothetical protein
MKTRTDTGERIAPTRLLEMLEFRFGAFKALAYASCELASKDPEFDPPLDKITAWALLEFGDDLEQAYEASIEWLEEQGGAVPPEVEGGCGCSGDRVVL